MRYFPTDVESVNVPDTGHMHTRKKGADRLIVDCAACDPYLAKYGGKLTLADVPPTYDERLAKEEDNRLAAMVLPTLAREMAQGARQAVLGKARE